jgi:Sugar phosphate isomerases/epimerases
MSKLSVAVQVYSVRDDAEKDFRGTMEQIKEMGYEGVELAGLYGYAPEEIRDILKETGLTAVSAHVPYLELIGDMEETIDKYITIGCSYIAVPYLTEEYRPGTDKFAEVVENIQKIGELCKKKNIILLYHNHDFEFDKMPDGRYALDYIYETVSPEYLQTEIDTCWVKVSGVDPAEYVRKYTDRAPVVHLKDFVGERSKNMYKLIGIDEEEKQEEEVFQFRAVGYGKQDFPSILKASEEAGAKWVVVEQDAHYENTALQDIKLSREYLKGLGL